MKHLILIIAIVGFAFKANAQTATKEGNDKAKVEQVQLKDHVCTDACKKAGKCVYAHGEKGHVCTDDCKKMAGKQCTAKDHVCTDACKKAGKCVYAHGEKGHVCSDECKKDMKK